MTNKSRSTVCPLTASAASLLSNKDVLHARLISRNQCPRLWLYAVTERKASEGEQKICWHAGKQRQGVSRYCRCVSLSVTLRAGSQTRENVDSSSLDGATGSDRTSKWAKERRSRRRRGRWWGTRETLSSLSLLQNVFKWALRPSDCTLQLQYERLWDELWVTLTPVAFSSCTLSIRPFRRQSRPRVSVMLDTFFTDSNKTTILQRWSTDQVRLNNCTLKWGRLSPESQGGILHLSKTTDTFKCVTFKHVTLLRYESYHDGGWRRWTDGAATTSDTGS